ncbi:MAG: amidohydrolase [Angelakisella sp.]|jgi:imidazolonepropionase-like amidohydrolase|nr:amidohydrolase [Angelakisella sp.]
MIIQGGTIHIGDGTVIENGYLRLEGERIAEVSPGTYTGEDREVLDARGMIVTPGFIDAHCHIGMWEEGLDFEGDDGNEMTDPCTPHLRAIDGVNPLDRAFQEALDYGITTVVTGPGSANPVAGQICAMKTLGRVADEMVIAAPVGMKFALGENPKSVYNEKSQAPMTRMAIAAIIREELQKAKRYMEDCKKAEKDEDTDPPELDVKCEALLPVLEKKVKAHFHVHRADDICTALRIIREFDLDGVIVHGTEGYLIADTIARAGVPVICGPIISTRGKPELRNLDRRNTALLLEAGVVTAINTDAPEVPIDLLAAEAAITVTAGVPREKAVALITGNPAKICGLENRVGRIAPGLDGDLLLFDQEPIGLLVKPRHIFVNGKQIR